jgi:hypothetical protein
MALQPKARAAGSSLSLRFTGTLDTVAAANNLVYPQKNGALPVNIVSTTKTGIRFLLANIDSALTLADPSYQLPSWAFDDTQPAGAAPHAYTTGAVANILSATDQVIGEANSSTARTWAANLDITVLRAIPGGGASAITVYPTEYRVVLDAADSGLGASTGLPVVVLPMAITHAVSAPTIDFDMIVTVNHSKIR